MVLDQGVNIRVRWIKFDFKGNLESRPTEIYLDDNVVDFLDECDIKNRKPFELVITLPLTKKGVDINIFCLLWYIPFENDSEQRPTMPIVPTFASDKECIIRCYLENRLVPYSIVHKLPFFEEVERRHRVEGISPKWKGRMVGVMLLDWQFDDISNNKLRFLENLEFLIQQNTEGVLYSPLNPCDQFIRSVKRLENFRLYSQ
jgi:hypothetical protein